MTSFRLSIGHLSCPVISDPSVDGGSAVPVLHVDQGMMVSCGLESSVSPAEGWKCTVNQQSFDQQRDAVDVSCQTRFGR